MTLTVGSLFSGIGGLELGLERAGMKVVWQVENDPYAQKVLKKHWPDVERHGDVRDVHASQSCVLDCVGHLPFVDLICGGFPCQDLSVAGKGAGLTGERSGLWREFRRIVEEVRPSWVLIENVPALRSRGLGVVLRDLAALGFDAEWDCLSAYEFGAPHLRERIFVVAADAKRVQLRLEPGWGRRACREGAPVARRIAEEIAASYPDGLRRLESAWRFATERGWPVHGSGSFDSLTRLDDGLPRGVVGHARRLYGNAVVPQVAEHVGRLIIGALK